MESLRRLPAPLVFGAGIVMGVGFLATVPQPIKTLAAALQGDINGDGKVDVVDLSILLSNYGKTASPSPSPIPTTTPTPSAGYPALPAGATLLGRQNFETGTTGQSFTANQCTGDNNRIATDSAEGKVWEAWWDSGDPPVASHMARCEMSDMPMNGPGEYVYRYKFKVPVGSYLPGSGWHYRLQFHGDNPSTSPPIAMWTHAGPSASQFNLRFGAGDSSWFQTGWTAYPRDVWHTVQIRVKWATDATGWAEFHVDGQPVTTLSGSTRLTGKTLRASQGTPLQVYAKYGLDAGSLPTSGIKLHGFVAHFETYRVQ